MRDTLRLGDTHPRVTFAEVVERPHAFAVGALPNLEVEITVFDGNIWIATVDGKTAVTSKPSTQYDSATLLTMAHVTEWTEFSLPTILPLQEAVERISIDYSGFNTNEPFPFFIVGEASEFHLHVINGYCPVSSPNLAEEFMPWRLKQNFNTPITVVGFFAKNQKDVMTHHGSNIHIHALLDVQGAIATGHLDSVEFVKGAKLYLPTQ